MSAGLENNSIAPVFRSHGELLDTTIACTPFDPRTGGYDVGNPGPYVAPKPFPDFQGQLVAWYEKVGAVRNAYLLVGHDASDGQGLRWIQVTTAESTGFQYIDNRTTLPIDPYYLSNCDPPWVCE